MSVKISGISDDSIFADRQIRAGDMLVSINGNDIIDVLDYQYYITEPVLRMVFQKQDGRCYGYKIRKGQYEDIGLEFDSFLMDSQRSCTNHCIFCFVDQMPPGMRESLYFKDDDARLSFLYGNYITLTNLKQEEIDRIIKMKISPVNISVHTTDPALRCKMMHNRFAGERLDYLNQLAEAGITVNCQLVLCPGINDGAEMVRTLTDLAALYPGVQSIACVPVGITKYRDNLYPLESYRKDTAREVIRLVEQFSGAFFRKHGTRLAYVSDEFYIRADLPLPEADFYEDFAQLENGVGVIAMLYEDFMTAWEKEEADTRERNITVATGVDAAPFLKDLLDVLQKKWHNVTSRVYPITNDFFGETITVAGLVTATDLIGQLRGKELGDVLLLPDCMLRYEKDRFLDDLTVEDVERALDIRIKIVRTDGDALLYGILEE